MRFKVKRRATDDLWTKYIRIRDNYTCQKCRKPYPPDKCHNLGVSHLWGRGRENVRFDGDNCIALCTLPCHQKWGHSSDPTNRAEYEAFMRGRLGADAYAALEIRAHTYKKRDDALDKIAIKELLKGV